VISNNCEPYELPSTGSVGSRQFVGLGMLLMLMAAVACIKFKKMEEKQ
jgi:LPXTG-motif cell wall-anchored protein